MKVYKWMLIGTIVLGLLTISFNSISAEELSELKVTMKPVEINKQNDLYQIDISIPEIEGLSDKKFQDQVNDEMKTAAVQSMNDIIELAKQDKQEAKDNNRPFIPFELTISYQVKNDHIILSLPITMYQFTGGAHGITETNHINIDLKSNQYVKLDELFKPNSDYQSVINEEIKQQIKLQEATGEGNYFNETDEFGDAFTSITEDQSFYIEDGNLVIVFAQYEIAPGYMGQPTFSIPLSKLKDMLATPYVELVDQP